MTMKPVRYDFTIYQGAELYEPFAIEDKDGNTLNLASEGDGYTFGRLDIRPSPGADSVIPQPLTTENGGIVINYFTDPDGKTWSGYWYLGATSTAAYFTWGEAQYQMEISDSLGNSGHVQRAFYGIVTLDPEITT